MRRAWLFLLVTGGCFHPSPPAGIACGAAGACPDGLTCSSAGLCELADAGTHPDGTRGIDAPDQLRVHARVGHTIVADDGTLAEQVDPTALTVRLADGTSPAIVETPDGSIEFQRATPTQAYAITLANLEVDGTTAVLTYVPPLFGRQTATPVTLSTPISVSLSTSESGGSTTVFASGQRAEIQAPSPFSFSIDWRNATSIGGGFAGLLDASAGDALWFLHYAADGMNRTRIDSTATVSITQTDGSASTVDATLEPLAGTGCVTIAAPIVGETNRLTALAPMPTLVIDGLASQPAASRVNGGDLTLAFASVSTDSALDLPVAQPFPSEGLVAFFEVGVLVVHHVGTTSLNEPAGVIVAQALPSGAHACSAQAVVTLPAGAPYPTSFVLAGTALAADGQTVSLGSGATVSLAVTTDRTDADVYDLTLFDFVGIADAPIGRWISTTPSVTVARSLFQPDHTYHLRANIARGLPGAAAGDLSTTSYPVAASTFGSFTFKTN